MPLPRQRRTFSLEEKLRIAREASDAGVIATMKKYQLSYGVLQRWRKKYNEGIHSLQEGYQIFQARIKSLLEENARLRKIIADQSLELQLKTELIQKLTAQSVRYKTPVIVLAAALSFFT